ncbi:hypothetical protein PENSPDRAFT_635468 [Peniophora sp. CONT]|nr:hypothetical protein PENSPDRAFT_635468 [Peniophora sp. CONT]
MSRVPLQNLSTSTARASQNSELTPRTPRTPHSRAGRAEEGFTAVELDEYGEEEYQTYRAETQAHQSEPLLRSATDATFSHRLDNIRPAPSTGAFGKVVSGLDWARKNVGLASGVVGSCFLLILIYLALEKPATLEEYIGLDPNATELSPGAKLISYENYTSFPLKPAQYADHCAKLTGGFMKLAGFWDPGPDVAHPTASDPEVCESSITYMLDGTVGLLADLNIMAQVAGLAREFNRTFIVNDAYWDRGNWTDHFEDVRKTQPGPQPGCRVPPEEMVACPRSAKHWVITAGTAKYHLAHSFHETFEDPYSRGLHRVRPIYERARTSFYQTFIPNAENTRLIRFARSELASMLPQGLEMNNSYVGVHIRKGRQGMAWNWHQKPIPVSAYAEAATRVLSEKESKLVYIASDDPAAYDDTRMLLPPETGTLSLAESAAPPLRAIASGEVYDQAKFGALEESTRVSLTRGMIVDFAMLSGMWPEEGLNLPTPRAVVCGMNSNICRASALGYGFVHVFGHMDEQGEINQEKARWIDVDEKGNILPEWEAYELFN